ncbi:hypothetical protein AAG906_031261 [Vitis piasezkii]
MSSIGTSKESRNWKVRSLCLNPDWSDVYFGKQFREYEEAHSEGILFPQSVL